MRAQLPANINALLSVVAPAGVIQSTALDMAKWLAFHMDHGVVGGRSLVSPVAFAQVHASTMSLQQPLGQNLLRPQFPVGALQVCVAVPRGCASGVCACDLVVDGARLS